jgi:hypothetical protein
MYARSGNFARHEPKDEKRPEPCRLRCAGYPRYRAAYALPPLGPAHSNSPPERIVPCL